MIGSTISHYRILEKIGEGGMGIVYKAEDTKLKRTVALKFLPPELTRDAEAKQRFLHEARAAAALNHANIVTVYEINEHEGQVFIAMEYMEGLTLKELISADRPRSSEHLLPISQVVDIAAQIAKGLAVAHTKGIIHRDIKPANIFITNENVVKILDFGIAKLAGGETKLTKTGTTMGTAAYMSPEQAMGKEVDQRSDIWSLGVILYEMLSGETPFQGEYMQAVVYSILNQEPKPLAKARPDMPAGLEGIVSKSLAKNPTERYQTIAEFLADLQAVAEGLKPLKARQGWAREKIFGIKKIYLYSGMALLGMLVILTVSGVLPLLQKKPEASMIRSLAVLPLVNFSGDSSQEYFADGMTEELITNLAKIASLKVISRTSVMQFKGSKKSLREIADTLGVDGVIEGSVQLSGERVRINAQLINAKTDTHLWAERYERDLRDVLAVQNEVALAIARGIKVQLTPLEQARLASARPINPEAYEDYLKGKFYLNQMTPEGFEKGLAYLKKATEKDPTNPLPFAGLALGYSLIGHERHPDAFAQARAAARQAEELGGEPLAEMYLAFGMIKLCSDWNFTGAEKDLRRALELNPTIGEALRWYSWYLFLIGHRDEALAEMKRAQEAEPLTPLFYADRGWQFWWAGQNDKAIEEARKALELNPNFNEGLHVLGVALAEKGMYTEAIAAHQKLAAVDPDWRWSLTRTYAQAGRKDEARKLLAKFLAEKPEATGDWAGWFLAETYATLGEKDQAFHWLEETYKARMSFLPWICDNLAYAPLHGDPRFDDLVRRMNVPTSDKK
ncbi:MAG: protein kinase [Candidatus Aminicenantes bacterium]|nr:protein kinase [Candidatus Aminicenantes bacterium]